MGGGLFYGPREITSDNPWPVRESARLYVIYCNLRGAMCAGISRDDESVVNEGGKNYFVEFWKIFLWRSSGKKCFRMSD